MGNSHKMHCEAASFGVKHTFTIIEKSNNINNYYHFASDSDSLHINQIYLSNLDLLTQFIQYFKNSVNQSRDLSRAYDIQFNIDKNTKGYEVETNNNNDMIDRNGFVSDISSPTILDNNVIENLAVRKKQCLYYLAKGMTYKEIAFTLNLSQKTVEHYVENIKIKLNCNSRSDLIKLAWDMKIWDTII